MANSTVKPGQIWRCDGDGKEWLVTRTYEEFPESYAVLRPAAGARHDDSRRIQIEKEGPALPGFTLVEG